MKIKLTTINDVTDFTQEAQEFPTVLDVVSDVYRVRASSIMGLFSLNLSEPVMLEIPEEYKKLGEEKFKRWEV